MGSALFCFQAAECSEQQLDQTVVFQAGHTDQLGCCGNHNPESRVGQDLLDVHGKGLTLTQTLAFFIFKHSDAAVVVVKP